MPPFRLLLVATRASVLLVAIVTASQAQGPGAGTGEAGGSGRGGGEILSLLNYPAVKQEIQLTPDQKSKIDLVRQAVAKKRLALVSRQNQATNNPNGAEENAAATDGFDGGMFTPTSEIQAATQALQTYTDAANANISHKILTRPQLARLAQIDLQRQGALAVLNDDIARKLNIDEEVLAQMREIQNETRQAKSESYLNLRLNSPTFQTANGQLDREATQAHRDSPGWKATLARMRQTTDQRQNQTIAQIGKLLTKNQKARFKAMNGKDFDLTKLTNNPPLPPTTEAATTSTTTPANGQPKSTSRK